MTFFDFRADLVQQLSRDGWKGMLQTNAHPVENFWLCHCHTASRSAQKRVTWNRIVNTATLLHDARQSPMKRLSSCKKTNEGILVELSCMFLERGVKFDIKYKTSSKFFMSVHWRREEKAQRKCNDILFFLV